MAELEELIKKLPPDLRQEVADFAEFLLAKRRRKARRPLKLDWVGALRDYRDQYTALELVHKATHEWRGD